MFGKKKQKEEPEIPSSSLADIAFLLLVFFLVTTTIDVDTGIGLVLPPPPDPTIQPPPIKERNLLKVLVNSQGQILMDERPASLPEVKQIVKDFVNNNGANPDLSESPEKAIISLKTDDKTPYEIYINMLDEVKGAYKELRDAAARQQLGIGYDEYLRRQAANDTKEDIFKAMFPQKISEAEPDRGA